MTTTTTTTMMMNYFCHLLTYVLVWRGLSA